LFLHIKKCIFEKLDCQSSSHSKSKQASLIIIIIIIIVNNNILKVRERSLDFLITEYLQFQSQSSDQVPLWEQKVAKLHAKKGQILVDMHYQGIQQGMIEAYIRKHEKFERASIELERLRLLFKILKRE
jgi:hypothetical protein